MAGNAVIGALRVNLGLDTAEFQNGVKAVQGSLADIGRMFSVLGGAAVFAGFTVGIKDAVGRVEEMRKLSAQLDQALTNTGNTAGTSAKEIEGFADDLERTTGRAAEEVMAVSTNLATYGFGREAFFEAITLADDMGAAWGGDLKQNMEGLARALADPEKGLAMLTKRGITFTDEQKNMIAGFIKANDLAGAQGVIFEALNEQVQGVAAAGFGGLTKASANVTKAFEDMFEAFANGIGLNSGLAMSLGAIAVAVDFVTQNLGPIAKAAAVAGSALLVAFGPATAAAIASAAATFGSAVVGAIRAIGVAITANPIGLIIAALAAAVTAAFVFRDEIKQAIGIDFVDIAKGAANNTIGLFVGAYKAVTGAWGLIPAAFGDIFTKAMNASIRIVQDGVNGIAGALRNIPFLGDIENVDLSGWIRQEGQGLSDIVETVQTEFRSGFQNNYMAGLEGLFSGIGGAADAAGANVKGFGDLLDTTASSGGAGVDALKTKVDGLGGAFGGAKDAFGDLWSDVKSGLSSMATGVAKAFFSAGDAGQAALSAIGSALDDIADKALSMVANTALDWLFGAIGGAFSGGLGLGSGAIGRGVYGGTGGFFPAFPGLATGGRTLSDGIVRLGETGAEDVYLPQGAQVVRHSQIDQAGGGNTHVTFGVGSDQNGNLLPFIQSIVNDGIETYRKHGVQSDVRATVNDPNAWGNL